ncbi:MAG: hypothetical protein LLF95_03045 [Bacteroidales bacterium]|nr:hypothetical protein [Bacteroidales bacterium]
METYLQMKARHQKEVEAFPMAFAFNNEQFADGMKKLNIEVTDTKNILSIGGGGFIRRTDADNLSAMFDRIHAEEAEARKNDDYLFQMFAYELANHEYNYTWDLTDTLQSLGLTFAEVKANQQLHDALVKAVDEVRNSDAA